VLVLTLERRIHETGYGFGPAGAIGGAAW